MKHYRQKNNRYSFNDINTIMCLLGIAILVFSVRELFNYRIATPVVFNDYLRMLAPAWACLSIFFLAVGLKRIALDPREKSMTIGYLFGVFNKKYQVISPLKTQVITNLKNGKNIGIDILIQTNKGMVKFQSYAPRFRNRVDEFLSETEQIVNF